MKHHYLRFKKRTGNVVEVIDEVWGSSWKLDPRTAYFLRELDGYTDPYEIDPNMSREQVKELLERFDEEERLDDGKRVTVMGIGSVTVSLWWPYVTKLSRIFARIWNRLLMISWLPVLIAGVIVFLSGNWNGSDKGIDLFYGYLLVLVGTLLHEFSHACACIGYGGQFYEMGIMSNMFMPGAYVMITYDKVKNHFKRAQIMAAGIESNLLLTGACLCLLKTDIFRPYTLLWGALLNFMVAVFNCALLESLDGMGIYQELLGDENFLKKAQKLIKDADARAELRSHGLNGRATIIACYLIEMMQILLPIVLIGSVLNIVTAF